MKKFEELNDLIDHFNNGDCKIIFQSLTTLIYDKGKILTKIDFVGSGDGYYVTCIKTYSLYSTPYSSENND